MSERLPDLPDPGERVRRYSNRPLPPYRYVPGVRPHPTRDPAGHSYQEHPTLNRHAPWDPEDWRHLDDWLYGVDLFNHFYFWEAHEAWEGLWAAVDRDAPASALLQGLIQIAAALLKMHMGVTLGAHTLATQGLERLHRVAMIHARLLGLDLLPTWKRLTDCLAPLQHATLPVVGPDVPVLELVGGPTPRCGHRTGGI